MSGKTHRLQVGEISCIVLHEGYREAELTAEYVTQRHPNASEAEINEALQNSGYDGTPSSHMNALYIETDGTRILVDAGMDDSAKPNFGHIPAALNAQDITTADIDIVFITHFHGDHINGLQNDDGSPRYGNARYVTAQKEWDYWMSEATLEAIGEERATYLKSIMEPLKDQFSFLNDGDLLAPGVTLVDMPGHTLGHSGLLIESNGERFLHAVDLLHSLPQFRYTHWNFVYDTDADLAVESRRAILKRVADENLLTLFYHLPFPGLAHISANDDGTFTYNPV